MSETAAFSYSHATLQQLSEDVRREMLLDEMRHDDASDPMTLAKAEDMHLEAGRERDHGVTL